VGEEEEEGVMMDCSSETEIPLERARTRYTQSILILQKSTLLIVS
jgi:hypothetical protein